jgi:hypothetical protein
VMTEWEFFIPPLYLRTVWFLFWDVLSGGSMPWSGWWEEVKISAEGQSCSLFKDKWARLFFFFFSAFPKHLCGRAVL